MLSILWACMLSLETYVVCWFCGVEDWVWPQRPNLLPQADNRLDCVAPRWVGSRVGTCHLGPREPWWKPERQPKSVQSKKVAYELGSISPQCHVNIHVLLAGENVWNSSVSTGCQLVINSRSHILQLRLAFFGIAFDDSPFCLYSWTETCIDIDLSCPETRHDPHGHPEVSKIPLHIIVSA